MEVAGIIVVVIAIGVAIVLLLRRSGHPERLSGHTGRPRSEPLADRPANAGAEAEHAPQPGEPTPGNSPEEGRRRS